MRRTGLAIAAAIALGSAISAPMASAQVLIEQFDPTAETTRVTGAWKRYQTHVLKLSQHRYAVLFEPGWVHQPTAVKTVEPLCARMGRKAQSVGTMAPVDLVFEKGEAHVMQGWRVDCI